MGKSTCSIEDCGRPHFARGWCNMHWKRWRRHGDPLANHRLTRGVCVIEGCGTPHEARGWCRRHYLIWQAHGDPLYIPQGPEARFWAFVDKNGPSPALPSSLGRCWSWTGSGDTRGYGGFSLGGTTVKAYQFAFHLAGGTIHSGQELDHLCRNPNCVNPAHLEPVTHKENMLRGTNPAALHAITTHCPYGHPYDAENTRMLSRDRRSCRECERRRNREYKQRQREGSA